MVKLKNKIQQLSQRDKDVSCRTACSYIPEALKYTNIYGILKSEAKNKGFYRCRR